MAAAAAYDEIADWYEDEFLARTAAAGADVLGIERALRELLGTGRGVCLEIGCGTGVRAAQVRSLGAGSYAVNTVTLAARPFSNSGLACRCPDPQPVAVRVPKFDLTPVWGQLG